jgi:plasmid stabilization system protein ParE
MSRNVRSKLARADLRDAWLYIAQDNIGAADRFLERIDQTVRMVYHPGELIRIIHEPGISRQPASSKPEA